MSRETRSCQNCNNNFTIEPEDFKFYEKIKVPPPTWCPECRMIRRMVWWNEKTLYRRECDLCKKEVIAMYNKNTSFPVHCHNCWWSDKWDSLEYGRNYDFSKPFFHQLSELIKTTPRSNLSYTNVTDSEYLNYIVDVKNGYLVFGGHHLENVAYAKQSVEVKDSFDLTFTRESELCYETTDCVKSFKIGFSRYAEDCRDSIFLLDCRNCSNCIGCVALRNKSYCIFNKQYSKGEYLDKLKEFNLGSFRNLEKIKSEFQKITLNYPRRYAVISNSTNVVGDDIYNARNCYKCFYALKDAENCRYSFFMTASIKDSYDIYAAGLNAELLYEIISGIGQRLFFGHTVWHSSEVTLSDTCHSSNNLFACIGLRNKNYCILNKQYTKEEYEKLVPRIIEHMNQMPYVDKKGRIYRYGE